MTLADAIRKGSMQRPQAVGLLYVDYEDATCALGAAYEGVFGQLPTGQGDVNPQRTLRAQFPELETEALCPMCPHSWGSLWDVIGSHLNDRHSWSREQIADWLETRNGELQ